MNVGDDSLGVCKVGLQLGNGSVSFNKPLVNVRNDGASGGYNVVRVFGVIAGLSNDGTGLHNILADAGNDGAGVHNILTDVRDDHMCVDRKFGLEAGSQRLAVRGQRNSH